MTHATHSSSIRGFTLIELMTVIAVLALLLVAAVPSLAEFHRNSVLANTTNTLVSSIYRTRSEAMKSGKIAIMVPGDGTTDDWKQGWMIFIDNDLNRKYNADKDEIVFRQNAEQFPEYITITRSNGATTADTTPLPAVIFNASGYSRTLSNGFGAMTFEVKRNDKPDNLALDYTRRIKLAETGRLRTCRPRGSSDSKCTGIS